jgi:gamma-glutamylcyclotransferase (GGCT)/AIG2-like uncharacterized protein YtfP
MYYAAYGSNMDLSQMERRCRGAEVYGQGSLEGFRLSFRGLSKHGGGVATLDASEDGEVPCVVYQVDEAHLAELDRYEGYPVCYQRHVLPVRLESGYDVECIVYIKTGEPLALPRKSYLLKIVRAYNHLRFDRSGLNDAHRRSSVAVCAVSESHSVFVYGSLMTGFGNHRLLTGYEGQPASLVARYQMVSLGHFPALVSRVGLCDSPIVGELYEVDDRTLRQLDLLEGTDSGFYRRISLALECGRIAWVYVLNEEPSPYRPEPETVAANDWRAHVARGRSQPRFNYRY